MTDAGGTDTGGAGAAGAFTGGLVLVQALLAFANGVTSRHGTTLRSHPDPDQPMFTTGSVSRRHCRESFGPVYGDSCVHVGRRGLGSLVSVGPC